MKHLSVLAGNLLFHTYGTLLNHDRLTEDNVYVLVSPIALFSLKDEVAVVASRYEDQILMYGSEAEKRQPTTSRKNRQTPPP